ncbi:bacteriocin 51 precursor BacA [Enterococcus faecalis]
MIKKKVFSVVTVLFLGILIGAAAFGPTPILGYVHVHAESVKIDGPAGYDTYRITSYVTPEKTKAMAKQNEELSTLSAIVNFLGLTDFNLGVAAMAFSSANDAMSIFVEAAKQNKGVELTYDAHFGQATSDTYYSNFKYVYK